MISKIQHWTHFLINFNARCVNSSLIYIYIYIVNYELQPPNICLNIYTTVPNVCTHHVHGLLIYNHLHNGYMASTHNNTWSTSVHFFWKPFAYFWTQQSSNHLNTTFLHTSKLKIFFPSQIIIRIPIMLTIEPRLLKICEVQIEWI